MRFNAALAGSGRQLNLYRVIHSFEINLKDYYLAKLRYWPLGTSVTSPPA